MSIRLHDSKLNGEGLHTYVFIVEKFSSLGAELYSKPFHFNGHRWQLQAGIKDKYFGVFLRWLGGGSIVKGVKCKVNFTLGVVNKKELAKSIRRGNLTEEDAFTKAGCGVGWGKLAVAKRLLNDRDFVNDDSLCVELQCRLAETTFEHKFACALKPGDKFIKSSQFSLCNSRWSIILFPQGLPAKKGAAPQHDHVAAYLHCEDVGLLRYKVVFSFHARSKQAKQREISYNFFDECHASCNSFGIEQFMPSKDLKKVAKNGKVKIRLKIKSIESYFYLGIDPVHLKDAEGEGCTRGDLMDQCNNPLGLSLQSSQDGRVVFKMKFDPNGENVALDEMPYFKKIYWRAVVNSFVDDSKTVVVSSSEEAGKSSFCYSEAECSITSKLEMSEVRLGVRGSDGGRGVGGRGLVWGRGVGGCSQGS